MISKANPTELNTFLGIINNIETKKNKALSQVLRKINKNPLLAIAKDITAKKSASKNHNKY